MVVVAAALPVGPVRTSFAVDHCVDIALKVQRRQPSAATVVEVIVPSVSSTMATVRVATAVYGTWWCGRPMSARIGGGGVRPLLQRRSGDGTTPAGVFPLGTMRAWDGRTFRMFGNSADPGVAAGPYRRVVAGDCFGATPHTARYGHLVRRTASTCVGPDEYLSAVRGAYEYAALIGANMEPAVSGDRIVEVPYAAAIFLHRHSYDWRGRTMSTGGCVSLAHADLLQVLRSLAPSTYFAIGTADWLVAHV